MKKYYLLPLVLILFFGFASPVFAAKQTLSVSPAINDIELIPGKTSTLDLKIENKSDFPVGIHADISGLDESDQMQLDVQNISPLVNWTSVTPVDVIILPNSQKIITVTINTPKNTKTGGYYETVFLTPIVNKVQQKDVPEILSRVGVLVFGTIGKLDYKDLANKVQITTFKPLQSISENKPILTFTVKNNYFTHFKAKPFVTIKPLFGKEITTLPEEKYVLPGRSKTWQYEPPIPANYIFYKAYLAVSVGEGHQIFADTWLVIFPYKIVLGVIIALGIILLILMKPKRIKKAVKILFKK